MTSKVQLPQIRPENQSYLILNNVAKESNFGFLIRTANAFGAIPIVVGRRRYSRGGAAAGTSRTPVFHFVSLTEAVEFVREKGCDICGIEILDQAQPIVEHPFRKPTAFIIGNEGEGMNDRQKSVCDFFVYVPQFGNAVSLNVNLATGIVLHHYATWARYDEAPRFGEKFAVETSSKVR